MTSSPPKGPPSPVVDAHQHGWDPDRVAYDWLSPDLAPINAATEFEQLRPQLDAAGVDCTVMVQSADSDADTDYMFGVAAAEPRVAAVVGWVDLERPDSVGQRLEELTRRPGFVGVRSLIHNRADPDWLLRPEVNESLALIADRRLSFDVVSVLPRHLEHVPVLSQRHPELRMVIDHLSKPPLVQGEGFEIWRRLIAAAAENPLVHAKVSGLYPVGGDMSHWTVDAIRPAVGVALTEFGPQRLMYGGDWPISVLAGGYARVWAALRGLFDGLDDAARRAVLGETAVRFYRITADRLGPGAAATATMVAS